jgi:hypothetical protein
VQFDPERLRVALAEVPDAAWSLPSTYTETRVHHGYRRVVLVSGGKPWLHSESFRPVFDSLAPIHEAWLSRIDPGGFIVPHRDAGPWRERWQVPINAAGDWFAATAFTPEDGVAFPVQHWEPHAVVNSTDRPRIHLVLDRDIWIAEAPEPFELYPIPADMTDIVRRSLHG